MTMSNELNRDLLMELGEAEDKCRSISVGGTMFDDSILSQPPTPQNLVEVLGWRITDGRSPDVESPISDAGDDGEIFITVCINSQHWMIAQDRDRIIIPTPSTLRDVVYLCRLLGIPCEVRNEHDPSRPASGG